MRSATLPACCLLIIVSACSGESLTIERDGEAIAAFCIERAETAVERARGLRGHEPLCAACGLLIEFPKLTEACIENGGVTFAIDVVYIDDADRVSALELDVAADDATSRCHPGVLRVLEVTSGAAGLVAVGDTITR